MLKTAVLLNILWKQWYIFSGFFDEKKVKKNSINSNIA